jgi:RimJ/RimL family protein N-acetyltransferase
MGQNLRACRPGDEQLVIEAIEESRREIAPFGAWCHPGYSIDDARKWVDMQVAVEAAGGISEYLIVTDDDALLGACGLNQIDELNRRANLGYWVRTSACGRGVATRAVKELARRAFETTNLERLEIIVSVENLASLRVAEKAGAVREGVLRSRLQLGGRAHDAVVFSIVREAGQRA